MGSVIPIGVKPPPAGDNHRNRRLVRIGVEGRGILISLLIGEVTYTQRIGILAAIRVIADLGEAIGRVGGPR